MITQLDHRYEKWVHRCLWEALYYTPLPPLCVNRTVREGDRRAFQVVKHLQRYEVKNMLVRSTQGTFWTCMSVI